MLDNLHMSTLRVIVALYAIQPSTVVRISGHSGVSDKHTRIALELISSRGWARYSRAFTDHRGRKAHEYTLTETGEFIGHHLYMVDLKLRRQQRESYVSNTETIHDQRSQN